MGSLPPSDKDTEMVKSPMDKRSYKTLRLSNGLFALLVHDPEIYPHGYFDSVEEGEEDGRESNGEEKEYNGSGSDGSEQKRKKAASSPPTKKVNTILFCVDPSQLYYLHFYKFTSLPNNISPCRHCGFLPSFKTILG